MKAEFAAEVIQCPTTTEEWTAIAEQFEKRWQACGGHLSLEYWLCVQKLQGLLVHCPHGPGRRRLQVSLD